MTSVEPRFFTTSLLPVRERLVLRGGRFAHVLLRVRVGYFHHPRLGHTLIDTGYGASLSRHAPDHSLALALYRALLRPTTLREDPLADGLGRLGLGAHDIDTVILTHFHADHVGGLAGLPRARILCPEAAWSALSVQGLWRNAREGVFAELLPADLESRLSFVEDAPTLPLPHGLGEGHDVAGDGSVLVTGLGGHAAGHAGLCFPGPDRALLYAADAQWLLRAVTENRAPGFPARILAHDRMAARRTKTRLRAFLAAGGEVMLCHDPEVHRLDLDPEVGG